MAIFDHAPLIPVFWHWVPRRVLKAVFVNAKLDSRGRAIELLNGLVVAPLVARKSDGGVDLLVSGALAIELILEGIGVAVRVDPLEIFVHASAPVGVLLAIDGPEAPVEVTVMGILLVPS